MFEEKSPLGFDTAAVGYTGLPLGTSFSHWETIFSIGLNDAVPVADNYAVCVAPPPALLVATPQLDARTLPRVGTALTTPPNDGKTPDGMFNVATLPRTSCP